MTPANTLKVAYLGPKGTFSHEFALNRFGSSAEYVPVDGPFEAIIQEVSEGRATHGVIPFCNSNGNHIQAAHRALAKFIGQIFIHGCYRQRIIHNFVTTGKLKGLKKILSKPEVFSQCSNWLSQWETVEQLPAQSTAAALGELLKMPPEEQRFTGVICNKLAVDEYGGVIEEKGIENPKNVTLFVVISGTKPSADSENLLICVTCPTFECLSKTTREFAESGYPTVFSSLQGEFSEETPIFLEVQRQRDSLDIEPLVAKPHRAIFGGFPDRESISTCVTNFFLNPNLDSDDDDL